MSNRNNHRDEVRLVAPHGVGPEAVVDVQTRIGQRLAHARPEREQKLQPRARGGGVEEPVVAVVAVGDRGVVEAVGRELCER